jgi:hypothetical protein
MNIPYIFKRLAPAKPTIVYDTYWKFATERQAIFFRRLCGELPPWTTDQILQTYKFTNAYRASDRVSQYLIRNVIYTGDPSPTEVFFRTLIFKIFNRIDTWELLTRELGGVVYSDYSFKRYDLVLSNALSQGKRIYSAAYIMPSGGGLYDRKHRMHLDLIERMIKDELPIRLTDTEYMREAFDLLLAYPTIGTFLAYQFVTDINYSTLTDFSEMEFVTPGPGALDGIHKCFSDLGGLNEAEIIKLVADRQEMEFSRLNLRFHSLWGRPLQLIDCQNIFCEVSKYSRISHPNIRGKSERTRIKQKFCPSSLESKYFFPPKWGLNERIPMSKTQLSLNF